MPPGRAAARGLPETSRASHDWAELLAPAAEERAEHTADERAPGLRPHGAGRALRHHLDETLCLLAASWPTPPEQNVGCEIAAAAALLVGLL